MLTTLPSYSSHNDSIAPAVTASDRIRARLIAAKHRYYANDNISAFIHSGELEELLAEVEGKMRDVLDALVIDIERDHNTADTAGRVAKLFIQEVFRGRYEHAPAITSFPNISRLSELITVGPIKVCSACSHHLCPILGKVWIGVLPSPDSDLIGLSKYARLCDWIMSRPQIQEEAVVMLADELEGRMAPDGLAVVMQASHLCMRWRGVKDDEALMKNSVMRGAFLDDVSLRREFLSLLNTGRE
ncbi:GTP cyclohydrolase I [Pusillimonas sp.]|uniref:GTP cyclohydrolase I n=1 Tax=Pusillimonas sp. TaxID=3040095 RepID=UPI0037CBF9AF